MSAREVDRDEHSEVILWSPALVDWGDITAVLGSWEEAMSTA